MERHRVLLPAVPASGRQSAPFAQRRKWTATALFGARKVNRKGGRRARGRTGHRLTAAGCEWTAPGVLPLGAGSGRQAFRRPGVPLSGRRCRGDGCNFCEWVCVSCARRPSEASPARQHGRPVSIFRQPWCRLAFEVDPKNHPEVRSARLAANRPGRFYGAPQEGAPPANLRGSLAAPWLCV